MEIGNNQTVNYSSRRVLLESIDGGSDVLVTEGKLTKANQSIAQPPGFPPLNRIVIENQIDFEGWKHEDNIKA